MSLGLKYIFAALQQFARKLPFSAGCPPAARALESPIRSNRSFAILVAISLGLGAVLMFVSLHHAASNMQATM
jgi:hypothetical protein